MVLQQPDLDRAARMILGLDAGSRTVAEAEHLLHEMAESLGLPAGTVGCTHFVRTTDLAHVACSLSIPAATGSDADTAPTDGAGTTSAGGTGAPRAGGTRADSAGGAGTAPAGVVDLGALPAHLGAALGDARTGPGDLAEGAALAAAAHAAGSSGRLVLFPGRDALTGTLTTAEVLARSAVERVVVLGRTEDPAPDAPLATNDFVRPQWRDGRIVLLAMPAAGGMLMPAEVPNPTPCCADHG
ncbi:hypothetical protein ABZT47_14180 [Sphaerisporangium sp. NPDC005289]|uniref:hypothetical protein n=1 Tax=Sphaerisporangium sp. NPDC005289 TaxID=3155247 RepID=UPI0033A1CFC1